MVADDAAPGGVEAEEVVPTEGEVDAGCMDDEAGGSGDEDMTDEDDPQPAIQFFRAAGLLDFSVGDYNAYLGGGIRILTFKLGKGFAIRQRSSTSLVTTPSLLRGSTIAPDRSQ